MCPVPERDSNRIGDKWDDPLGLLDREFHRQAPIEDKHHSVLGDQMRPEEGHAPAVHDHIVMRKRPWKANTRLAQL
jgi:hypothetical protein